MGAATLDESAALRIKTSLVAVDSLRYGASSYEIGAIASLPEHISLHFFETSVFQCNDLHYRTLFSFLHSSKKQTVPLLSPQKKQKNKKGVTIKSVEKATYKN